MFIIQPTVNYPSWRNGTLQIEMNGKMIDGPFADMNQAVQRLIEIGSIYCQKIEGWNFSFTPEGCITVSNDIKIGKHGSYLIQNHPNSSVDPRNVTGATKDILITPMALLDVHSTSAERDSIFETMKEYIPEVRRCLTIFCSSFVTKAAALNFNPYDN